MIPKKANCYESRWSFLNNKSTERQNLLVIIHGTYIIMIATKKKKKMQSEVFFNYLINFLLLEVFVAKITCVLSLV